MLKRLILSLALFFLVNVKLIQGCSCQYEVSLCDYVSFANSPVDIVISCVITDTLTYGINTRIIQVLNGTESRDTITIWDRKYFNDMCHDSLTDKANSLGSIGDTIIIALTKIDSLENSWDVLNDYRRPDYLCNHASLNVQNNIVYGLISGHPYCHFYPTCIWSLDYNDFIQEWPTRSQNCSAWIGIEEVEETLSVYPNPFDDFIMLKNTGASEIMNVEITDALGCKKYFIINDDVIEAEKFSDGVYFLKVVLRNNKIYFQKMIKN